MKRVNVMNKHTTIDKSTGEKKCSCFKRCGGCQLDKVYAQQIEWKQAKADRMLSRFCRPQQIITMDDPIIIAIKSKLSIRSIAQSVSSQEYISPLPIAW